MGLEALLSQQIIGLSESIDDRVAALLIAGTGITLTYNDGAGTLTIAASAGIGGSTGSTDNRILRADGTGGATVQNSAVTIDDSGNISGLGTVACGAVTATGKVLVAQNNQIDYLLQLTNNTTTGTFPVRNGLLIETTGTGGGSSSSQLLRVNSYGSTIFALTPTLATLNANLDGVSILTCIRQVVTNSASSIPSLIVRIGTNPTANVTEWQDSGQVVRAAITSAFGFTGTSGVFSGLVSVGTYTVATLPSASANPGRLAQVTDSSVTANGSTVAGGGSNRVLVYSNGSAWDVVVA